MRESGMREPGPGRRLSGARVLVTRSPDRAAALVAALADAGAQPLLLPLIDFERARDQHALDSAFEALRAGAYQWLVISSSTAVLALREKAGERGLALSQWLPPGVRVATVGASTRRLLEAEGIRVELSPGSVQSAAGLIEAWPEGRCSVLLPQADIAAPALRDGLTHRGATVHTVTAYHTVDYPADPARAFSAAPAQNPVLTPAEAKAEVDAGSLAAVVAASPSAVRRIHKELAPLGACRLVAIGHSTADEASALGLPVAATAHDPTPEGLVTAVLEALAGGFHSADDLLRSNAHPHAKDTE
jgi:uroporphyrinogen-III synthase